MSCARVRRPFASSSVSNPRVKTPSSLFFLFFLLLLLQRRPPRPPQQRAAAPTRTALRFCPSGLPIHERRVRCCPMGEALGPSSVSQRPQRAHADHGRQARLSSRRRRRRYWIRTHPHGGYPGPHQVRSSCNHCDYSSRGDSLRWEVVPCETVGAGGGGGSADVDQFSRYGHTACLIDGCSQIVVFGGMRCSGGGDSAVAAPLVLNDLLLFDPDMLKWCASSNTRHLHSRLHRPLFAQDPGSPFIRTLPPSPRLSRRRLCRLMHGPAPLLVSSTFFSFCKHATPLPGHLRRPFIVRNTV